MNQAIQTAEDFKIIHSYTRAMALEDGVLMDVSQAAKEAGFKFPMAITEEVWNGCVAWTEQDNREQTHQDQRGRLHDVLWMAYVTVLRASRTTTADRLLFRVSRIARDGRSTKPSAVILKLVLHPGDDGQPVFTIMGKDQD